MHKTELDFAAASGRFPGTEVRHLEDVTATALSELAHLVPYNKARPFRLEHRHLLDDLLAFYTGRGLRPAIEVRSPDAGDELHELLRAADLAPMPPTVALHVRPDQVNVPAAVLVEEVGSDDDRYLDTLFRGYGIGADETAFRDMLSIEHSAAGFRRYLAFVDGQPAAAAGLFAHDGTGILAGAATVPRFRRHGYQTALIARRLRDAATSCDLAVVTAALDSPSHANLTRLGCQLTHTRTVWR